MDLYDVLYQNSIIGNVKVQNRGLFTEFNCLLQTDIRDLLRVVVNYDDKKMDLGICVPEGESFIIKRMIPTKNLGKGLPRFYVVDRNDKPDHFIPLSNDKAFQYLHMLDKAKYVVNDGMQGLNFSCPDWQASRQNKKSC